MENTKINQNYQVHDLKITLNGNEINTNGYNIINFNMSFKENQHTIVNMELEIKEEYAKEWEIFNKETLSNIDNDIFITFSFKERKHFAGVIQKLEIAEHNSKGLKIFLEIKSKSELMDRNKYYKVYQNPNITYLDIVKELAKKYEDRIIILGVSDIADNKSEMISKKLFEKISNGLIIQYYETDWEFLIRIISHLGIGVFNTENGGITLGFINNMGIKKELNKLTSSLTKVREKKDIYYKVYSQEYYILGDEILNENELSIGFISQGEIKYDDGKFKGEYILKNQDYIFPCIYNENIKGCSIEGKVVRIPLKPNNSENIAVLTLDFFEGLKKTVKLKLKNNKRIKIEALKDEVITEKHIERFQFPYAVFYSKTKTGYFCAPEIGDTVVVIFPTTEECEGYVAWAVNNKESLRFSNPFIRNYKTTEKEKEILEQLNKDKEENIKLSDMIETVLGSDRKLYNFAISSGVFYEYTKESSSEETNYKNLTAQEEINFLSNKVYKLNANDIQVAATNTYLEKAETKDVSITTKNSIYETKNEKGTSFEVIANSHNVNIK